MDESGIYKKAIKGTIQTTALRYTKLLIQGVNKRKGLMILILIIWLIIVIVLTRKDKPQLVTLKGVGFGKNYTIQYRTSGGINYQAEIDSLFVELEQNLDAYKEDSEVAKFNKYTCEAFYFKSPFLYTLLAKSKEVYTKTHGAFDPTVATFIESWKKSMKNDLQPTELDIQALREYVDLDYIVVNDKRVKKLKEGVKIDLNSLIPGYGADAISNLLQSKGIKDLCIELANEAVMRGLNKDQKRCWQITHIIPDSQGIISPFSINSRLSNKAVSIAMQGTAWEREKSIRIIIDPQSGYPAQTNIIAALVFADDCITASAYATAIVAKEFSKFLEILEKVEPIEVFLVYKNELGEISFYNSKGLQVQHVKDSQDINIEVMNNSIAVN